MFRRKPKVKFYTYTYLDIYSERTLILSRFYHSLLSIVERESIFRYLLLITSSSYSQLQYFNPLDKKSLSSEIKLATLVVQSCNKDKALYKKYGDQETR